MSEDVPTVKPADPSDRRGAWEPPPRPVVSVIVPTHDRRPLLERKLRSLEGEALDFEVIVVADACTDDTEKFLTGYQPPYHFSWTTGPGLHAANARNIGAERARGEVLLFSDDDAIPSPGWVAENLRLHEEPGYVGLSRQVLSPHLQHGATLDRVWGWQSTNGCSLSMRAELFAAVGGYDASFSSYGGEDLDLGWRLKQLGAKFRFLPNSPVEHWDEGYLVDIEQKGRSAGAAHVRVWRKHGGARLAWALGVHPVMLAAKRALLGLPARLALRSDRYRWERAYAEGARAELRRRGGAYA